MKHECPVCEQDKGIGNEELWLCWPCYYCLKKRQFLVGRKESQETYTLHEHPAWLAEARLITTLERLP